MRRPPLRWWLVALAALAMGAAGSYQFAWSTIRGPLGARLGAGETALGTIFTLFVLAQTLSQLPAGRYRDRYGPRLPLAAGGLLVAAGFAGVALAPSVPLALAAYALGGVGAGAVYTVAVNTPVKWFDDRRGLATSAVATSYSVVSVPVIAFVGPNVGRDFAGTLLVVAAATGLACLVAVPFLRDPGGADGGRDGVSRRADSAPGDDQEGPGGPADVAPDADPDTDPDRSTDVDPDVDLGSDAPALGWRKMLRTWQFWTLYGVSVVVHGVGLMLIGKAASLAAGLGLPAAVGTLAASTIAVADGAGIAVVGGLSDRFGHERTVAVSLTLAGLALAGVVTLGPTSGTAFVALAGAVVFFHSPVFGVFPSLVGDYYGPARSSENYALLYSAKVPGGIAGGTAASLLVAAVGWSRAFLLGAGLLVLAGLAAATLRPVQRSAITAESAA